MPKRSLSARLSRLSFLGLFAFVLGVMAMTGCKKPEYPACKRNKHCNQEMGEKCVDGTCQNCVENSECAGKGPNGEDYVCYEFRGRRLRPGLALHQQPRLYRGSGLQGRHL
jgi:hypothetical protein